MLESSAPVLDRRNRRGGRREEAAERRRLEQDLRQAAATDGFALMFQPRPDLPSGAIVAAEALLRLPSRRRGRVPVAALMPAAERGGLGTAVAGALLRAACQEAAAWPEAVRVSVPLASCLLEEGGVLRAVAEALEASGLPAERLELALGESALVQVDSDLLLVLAALRDLGVGLMADQFGLALAPLAALRHLPLTAVRLDRSVVRDVGRDDADRAVVTAVVACAHALGLRVVAEGVEAPEQCAAMLDASCDEAQGSLFSPPLPSERLFTLPGWPGRDTAAA